MSLRALNLEKAHGRRQSPHTPEGCGRAALCGCHLSPPSPISTLMAPLRQCLLSRVPCAPRPAAPRRGAAAYLAAAPTADSIQGRASDLSRPLNSEERARARRLACDWLLGRGWRRQSRGARVNLPLPFPQRERKREVRRLGTGRGRDCCQTLSSDWLSGNLTAVTRERGLSFSHAQLVRMSLRRERETTTGVRRVRRVGIALAIPLLRWFWFPQNFGGGD